MNKLVLKEFITDGHNNREKSATMPADSLVWVIMPMGGQNANEGPKYHRA